MTTTVDRSAILTDKQHAAEALARMSEFATLEEIGAELAIFAGIQRGERDAEAGRIVTQAEAVPRSETWLGNYVS